QLVLATRFQLGATYDENALKTAKDQILDVVRRNGFYHATVEATTDPDQEHQQINFQFMVDPGKRAKFDGLITTGDTERAPESLIKSTGWKRFRGLFGWHSFTEARLRNGLENIRSWYPKHDHLLAKVRLVKLDYHEETNKVTPEVSVDSGARVQVRLRGAKLS